MTTAGSSSAVSRSSSFWAPHAWLCYFCYVVDSPAPNSDRRAQKTRSCADGLSTHRHVRAQRIRNNTCTGEKATSARKGAPVNDIEDWTHWVDAVSIQVVRCPNWAGIRFGSTLSVGRGSQSISAMRVSLSRSLSNLPDGMETRGCGEIGWGLLTHCEGRWGAVRRDVLAHLSANASSMAPYSWKGDAGSRYVARKWCSSAATPPESWTNTMGQSDSRASSTDCSVLGPPCTTSRTRGTFLLRQYSRSSANLKGISPPHCLAPASEGSPLPHTSPVD